MMAYVEAATGVATLDDLAVMNYTDEVFAFHEAKMSFCTKINLISISLN
jgi:hypothetical protein